MTKPSKPQSSCLNNCDTKVGDRSVQQLWQYLRYMLCAAKCNFLPKTSRFTQPLEYRVAPIWSGGVACFFFFAPLCVCMCNCASPTEAVAAKQHCRLAMTMTQMIQWNDIKRVSQLPRRAHHSRLGYCCTCCPRNDLGGSMLQTLGTAGITSKQLRQCKPQLDFEHSGRLPLQGGCPSVGHRIV